MSLQHARGWAGQSSVLFQSSHLQFFFQPRRLGRSLLWRWSPVRLGQSSTLSGRRGRPDPLLKQVGLMTLHFSTSALGYLRTLAPLQHWGNRLSDSLAVQWHGWGQRTGQGNQGCCTYGCCLHSVCTSCQHCCYGRRAARGHRAALGAPVSRCFRGSACIVTLYNKRGEEKGSQSKPGRIALV